MTSVRTPFEPGIYWYRSPEAEYPLLRDWVPILVVQVGEKLLAIIPGMNGKHPLQNLRGEWGASLSYHRL